jgi:phosphoribosylamine---glycine ligase
MKKKWNVLLLGSGGREHAIAHSILKSPLLESLKVYPGNGGFDDELKLPQGTLGWKPTDKKNFQDYVKGKFDLVIVGPEDPLVAGVADWCKEIHIPCFGPSAYCAQIEGSKDFAKKLMKQANVPTAKHETFSDYDSSWSYVQNHGIPIVIKADGLAAGKGVTVCTDLQQAELALKEIFLDQKFGSSGEKVVIEDFLEGEEASVFAICDGEDFVLLPAAQDHKRAYDGDKGPNTGGMGAYCPAPIANKLVMDQVSQDIVAPILHVFRTIGQPYVGVLYVGLMIDKNSQVKVVEFNCRFGDPETQAVLQLVEDDLLNIFYQASHGMLSTLPEIKITKDSASIIVLAAEGYPGDYVKNIDLKDIDNIDSKDEDVIIFHAGTIRSEDGNLLSSGGRILGIVSRSKTLAESIDKNYRFLNHHSIPSTFFRKDIGRRAL